jgi:hypothetical protein
VRPVDRPEAANPAFFGAFGDRGGEKGGISLKNLLKSGMYERIA